MEKDVVSVQRIADDELEVYYNSNNEPYILRFSEDFGNEGRLFLNDVIMLSQKVKI